MMKLPLGVRPLCRALGLQGMLENLQNWSQLLSLTFKDSGLLMSCCLGWPRHPAYLYHMPSKLPFNPDHT